MSIQRIPDSTMPPIPAHKPTTEEAKFLELLKAKSAKANNANPAHSESAINEKTVRNLS